MTQSNSHPADAAPGVWDALILAAGKGLRSGRAAPKQFEPVAGASLAERAAASLLDSGAVRRAVLVLAPDAALEAEALGIARRPGLLVAAGGAERADSVAAGLEALAEGPPEGVLIHDSARGAVPPAVLARLKAAVRPGLGAVPVLPLADALWSLDGAGQFAEPRPRAGIVRAQTPQAFIYQEILDAYRRRAPGADALDCAAVYKAAGGAVAAVEGSALMRKLTVPEDYAIAEKLYAPAPMEHRTGMGFDVHAFEPGEHVTLCGVRIAHTHRLAGHSDADVGWHALTDAILGALGAGDIGQHFPPSDDRWKGADSRLFLSAAADLARERGARLVHADVTLICEAPKIGPHREAMRAQTAAVLGLEPERVNIKATTTERLGFTGRGEGIAAQAVATVAFPLPGHTAGPTAG